MLVYSALGQIGMDFNEMDANANSACLELSCCCKAEH